MTGRVTVIGLGPAGPSLVTAGALATIERLPHRFLRTARHPAADVVPGATTFDAVYERAERIEDVYDEIVAHLVAAAGAPPAAADPACWFTPASGTKHVAYAGLDGHVHDLAWVPGAAAPTWTDLTLAALAPPAHGDRVAGFAEAGSATSRVVFRGTDGHLHEIRWG